MAKREVVFSGFSGLFAFGVGVAVGANWPRASNFVGFVLQRLGFELTDLALWMWDPEKSAGQDAEVSSVKQAKAKKRAEELPIRDGHRTQKQVGAKAKKSARSPGRRSGAGVQRATLKKAINGNEARIRSNELNGSTAPRNGRYVDSPLMQSDRSESPAGRRKPAAAGVAMPRPDPIAIRTTGPQPKRPKVKTQRKTSSNRRRQKTSEFPGTIVPAEAALN